jgi:sec-independent protein translocase protein TatA
MIKAAPQERPLYITFDPTYQPLMGASEIIFILFVYLMLFGAKGVPSLARSMGQAIRQFREASSDIQREIMTSANEVKKQVNETLDQAMIDQPEPMKKPESPKPEDQKK